MVVSCRNDGCKYYENSFCSKPIVNIDNIGMCTQQWRKGEQRFNQPPVTREMKTEIVIETINEDEIVFVNQQKGKGAGTRLEDPPDGTAAHEQETEKTNVEEKDV